MTSATKPRLAFFGATGGCAGSALAFALKDGYKCSALARTPSKLRKLLEEQYKVSSSILDSNLTIVQGSAKDVTPVKETIAPTNTPQSGETSITAPQPAQVIISGIGGRAYFQWSLTTPVKLEDPNICGNSMATLLQALRELRRESVITEAQRPLLLAVSTTGMSKTRDVPIPYVPLYHVLLKVPHADKKVMEKDMARASTETGPEAPISGFVIARATLLMDGEARGLEKVRVGWETHPDAVNAKEAGAPGPAIGYTIRRADVGLWIFEEVVKNGENWKNKCVTLTS